MSNLSEQEQIQPDEDTTSSPKEPRSQDISILDSMIDALEAQNQELNEKLDKVMRAFADAENRAKRAEKDRMDALKYGASKMARDLLEVADNLNRAITFVTDEQKEQLKEMFEGVELTEKSLLQIFERHNIIRLEITEGKFDPNNHEAITQIPVAGKEAGDIIDVVRHGYKMGDRLLRPAQVVVCA